MTDRRETLQKHGLTEEVYGYILGQQEGKCAICGEYEEGNGKKLAIDHDHTTGQVRGLLCAQCNLGLGNFRDSVDLLERAIAYLANNGTKPRHPLQGKFFLSRPENWQGIVLEHLGGDIFLIQLYSWMDGLPTIQRCIPMSEMFSWDFFSSYQDWRHFSAEMAKRLAAKS